MDINDTYNTAVSTNLIDTGTNNILYTARSMQIYNIVHFKQSV